MGNLLFYIEKEIHKMDEKKRNILIKGLKKENFIDLGEKFESIVQTKK